ncbi:hypothetical protein MPK66_gp021 [Erwinia phage pEa_SNUABM_2]|uniref:Uncharacterized protein n=1 Tax=Erwinia phage pEa_SNUABM_2 TaxID=2869547 RepID=A0AAE7XPG2_9CAUD|nr:hypothetical protein MPK66_gp021 [Erwinia phage pEa_SNUABM_2]QZE59265.1 hypothetical protein pEaSNUABM2_00021 [Erwinia phage pEa_SNUABM_2]
MISDITVGRIYKSRGDKPFIVDCIAAHGQDCSLPMVIYRNLEDTSDKPAGTVWVITESLFVMQFSEYESGEYHEHNEHAPPSIIKGIRSCILPLLG